MRIALIGTGNVGGALARGLARTDHEIVLGVQDTTKPEVSALAAETQATTSTPAEAAHSADIIILAVPWGAAQTVATSLGDLGDRIVIDCTNPLGPTGDNGFGLTVGHTQSGGEQLASWLTGGRLVKTLNQVGAEIMANATLMPRRPVMFMAGNDSTSKETVSGLLNDLGFDPLDAGDLTKARILEPLALVWINQAIMQGMGRQWALSVVPLTA